MQPATGPNHCITATELGRRTRRVLELFVIFVLVRAWVAFICLREWVAMGTKTKAESDNEKSDEEFGPFTDDDAPDSDADGSSSSAAKRACFVCCNCLCCRVSSNVVALV